MTRVYVPDGVADAVTCDVVGDEAHHLTSVVRVRVGDTVGVFDGGGREWRARVASLGRGHVTLDSVRRVAAVPEPPVAVTLGIGVLKGDQMDAVVRDATSLGVARIVPLVTDHLTVPKRAWQSGAALDRWRRVAIASAKQCGRAVVPVIAAVETLDQVLTGPRPVVACIEPSAGHGSRTGWPADVPAEVLLLVGPEGGWSTGDVARLRLAGAHLLSLGPRTLRAELAPAVALATLWTHWGGDIPG